MHMPEKSKVQALSASPQFFWQARFNKYGHTGWSNELIYAFDQQYRLKVFDNWLMNNFRHPSCAFDFGCGSGDFSKLLLEKGWNVTAYDPFVKPKIQHSRFAFQSEFELLEDASGSYDLACSVTVLDHVLDERAFGKYLRGLRSLLTQNGRLFLIEYAVDTVTPPSSYQAFRPFTQWQKELATANLNLVEAIPLFHPVEAVINSYKKYEKGLLTKLVVRMGAGERTRVIKNILLGGIAQQVLLKDDLNDFPKSSPLKMMICQPA